MPDTQPHKADSIAAKSTNTILGGPPGGYKAANSYFEFSFPFFSHTRSPSYESLLVVNDNIPDIPVAVPLSRDYNLDNNYDFDSKIPDSWFNEPRVNNLGDNGLASIRDGTPFSWHTLGPQSISAKNPDNPFEIEHSYLGPFDGSPGTGSGPPLNGIGDATLGDIKSVDQEHMQCATTFDFGFLPLSGHLDTFGNINFEQHFVQPLKPTEIAAIEELAPVAQDTASQFMRAIEGQVYSCRWSGCETRFTSTSCLHEHVKIHSKGHRTCRWSTCTQSCDSTNLLNKHIQNHTKPFECAEPGCHHKSAKSRDLRRHELTHGLRVGNKVYSCPADGCEYGLGFQKNSFKRLDHAKRHIARKHPGYKSEPIMRQL